MFQAHQYFDKTADIHRLCTPLHTDGPNSTIVVEEGNFAAVQGYRHEMRMTFDISPYPALEAYTKQSGRSIRAEEIIP